MAEMVIQGPRVETREDPRKPEDQLPIFDKAYVGSNSKNNAESDECWRNGLVEMRGRVLDDDDLRRGSNLVWLASHGMEGDLKKCNLDAKAHERGIVGG